jgi:branched-chain amino acid transport system substrate-binding protein
VSKARKAFAIAVLVALAWAVPPGAEAQAPIRLGASLSQTGLYAALGQNQLRGYQLCVKHMNEKGGVLGRKLELVVYDDGADPATAVRLYEKLITQDKVDLVLGPYTSRITNAVASVTEKHKMPMVAPNAGTTSIYRKGRKFIFMVNPPAEVHLEGLIDLAAKKGLKTVALINGDELYLRTTTQATIELAKKKGLQVVFVDAYPEGNTDFSTILTKVRAANPDVLGGATRFEDAVAITRQMKALNVNPRMVGLTSGVDLPKFYEVVGRDAEFVYGSTMWVPELVELRAGGLIPIAREYPGAREFVESHKKEFPGADLSVHSAGGYGAARFSSRPSGAPGLWTARNSATPF